MDGPCFDTLTRSLTEARSRRGAVAALLAGALGGLRLADTDAKKGRNDDAAKAEACIPTGKRCPSKKPRGQKQKQLTCAQCCQGVVAGVTTRKGKRVKKCTCRSPGTPCNSATAAECCDGAASCQGGVCGGSGSAVDRCTGSGQACTADVQCCTGVCNVGGAGLTGDECAACRTGGATCEAAPESCCQPRTCTAGSLAASACCSLLGERCVQGPTEVGSCCPSDGIVCTTDGPSTPATCCKTSGPAPGPVGADNCPNGANPGCCGGTCDPTTKECED